MRLAGAAATIASAIPGTHANLFLFAKSANFFEWFGKKWQNNPLFHLPLVRTICMKTRTPIQISFHPIVVSEDRHLNFSWSSWPNTISILWPPISSHFPFHLLKTKMYYLHNLLHKTHHLPLHSQSFQVD